MFEEDICRAIEEDEEGLDEFCGGHSRLRRPDHARGRSQIPSPAEFGKTAHPTTEREEPVPKEDPALDRVCEAAEDLIPALKPVSMQKTSWSC